MSLDLQVMYARFYHFGLNSARGRYTLFSNWHGGKECMFCPISQPVLSD